MRGAAALPGPSGLPGRRRRRLPPARPCASSATPRAYWRLLVRGAALLGGHARHLPVLARHRHAPLPVVEHRDRRRDRWNTPAPPIELLIGFLIAIAILVPLNVVFFVAALSLGTVGAVRQRAQLSAAVLSRPVRGLSRAALPPDPHRLSRRALPSGRLGLRYAVCASFWWILIVLTLGLAYPFAQSRLERFKMRHTYYGNLQGRFEGSGFRLFLRGFADVAAGGRAAGASAACLRHRRSTGRRSMRAAASSADSAASSSSSSKARPDGLRRHHRRRDRRASASASSMAAVLLSGVPGDGAALVDRRACGSAS